MKHLSEETIMELADGVLTPADQAAAEAHIGICNDCREQYTLYQSLDTLLSAENIVKAPPAITNRVMQQVELHQKLMLHKAQSRKTLIKFAAIMFVFMIAMVILAFVSGAGISITTPTWLNTAKDFIGNLKTPKINPVIIYGIFSVLVLFFIERIIYVVRRHKFAIHQEAY